MNALFDEQVAKGKDIAAQATSSQGDGGASLKTAATEKASAVTQEKTHEATQKGFDALNKSLGQ